MKPAFETITKTGNNSFIIRKFIEKSFSAPYHFHPEYELTLIMEGHGKRYVGSNMQHYTMNDLVLLGANLPHCWKTEKDSNENSISLVIQFDKDFLGDQFFDRPEMRKIARLLDKSNGGLQFTGNNKSLIETISGLMYQNDPFKRLVGFLNILHELAVDKASVVLDKQGSYTELPYSERYRINAVFAYIVNNFQNSVSLKEAASKANMTTHAFCKYFKRSTRKNVHRSGE